MKDTNPVVVDAIAAMNKDNKEAAQREAIRLIGEISRHQDKVKACEERIALHREEFDKLSKDVIDEARVFGGSVPTNANRETIVEVIAKANKERQYNIEQASSKLTGSIVAEQDAIKSIEKTIAKLREDLAKVAPVKVTAEQVVG